MAAKAPAEELDVDGVAVRLTSPDKPYYPALGAAGTKRAVVEHYRLVAPALLTAVRDRPTYLQRFPDGIEGEEDRTEYVEAGLCPGVWRASNSFVVV